MDAPIAGHVGPAYEPVRDAFAHLFETGAEIGAALAVVADGELVVDLCGGWVDAAHTRPWQPDTLVTVYSTGKPLAALATLRLVASGVLDLDEPMARWWPEFARHGKGGATLRHALAHQAGVPALASDEPVETLLDERRFAAAIAATPPEWEPGTAHGEHALTYGALLGEVVRRAGGRTLGTVFREELARPLGIDAAIGLTGDELRRVADVEPVDAGWRERTLAERGALWLRSCTNPAGAFDPEVVNGTGWRTGEIAAVNAHASARGLATVYAALSAKDERLLPRELLDEALSPQAVGFDRVLERDATWTLGFQSDDAEVGMGGTGGSAGFLSRRHGYAFGYVTRRLGDHSRVDAVAEAVDSCA